MALVKIGIYIQLISYNRVQSVAYYRNFIVVAIPK